MKVTTLAPVSADLHFRGFSRTYRKGGRYGPHWFDYDDVSKESPWRRHRGSVHALRRRAAAARRARTTCTSIMAPGDEATVEFDAASADSLPTGWKRDFLLYTDGWIKDADLNTAFGNTVGAAAVPRNEGIPVRSRRGVSDGLDAPAIISASTTRAW